MRLLNFSVGRVRTVEIAGEAIRTGHVKAPAMEPWEISEDGAVGDERAVHPDKLYAFSREAYDHWSRYLGVDRGDWPDGFFGENLTLDTIDETDIRVGDIFAIGADVRVIVAGSRNPCVKLTWRLNQPRSFQKVFHLSRMSGMYLGVLSGGVVRPGDLVDRIDHDATMPSVADVCEFVASHKPPPLEPLKRLLAFDRLSPTNRLLLSSKLDQAERAAGAVEGRWKGWRPFVIDKVVDETPSIRSAYVRPADGERLCKTRPGQFVSVQMEAEGGGTLRRSWSLSSFSHDPDHYRLTVRRQSGPGSAWFHDAVVGARIMLRAPTGEFALDMGGFRPVVLVAAGVGITPMMAMLEAHLTRPQAMPIYLIYGGRTPGDLAFKSDLDALAAAHPQVRVAYIYSRSDEGARPRSRITPNVIIEQLADLHIFVDGRRIDLPWHEGDIYLCGPGDFCQTIKDDFVARGANGDHIFLEQFAAPEIAASELDEAEVRFARGGVQLTWKAGDDLTLLELAEAAGLKVDSDCRAGSCLTCKTAVLEGATTADTGDGAALLCLARPRTAALVLDL